MRFSSILPNFQHFYHAILYWHRLFHDVNGTKQSQKQPRINLKCATGSVNISQSLKTAREKKAFKRTCQMEKCFFTSYGCYLFSGSSVTRNFLGQGSFLGIRALRWTIIYNTKKKGPAGKILRFFLLKTFKNCTLKDKFNTDMTSIRAFFPKIRTLFFDFQKRAGETSLSPLPPSRYAPFRWHRQFSLNHSPFA